MIFVGNLGKRYLISLTYKHILICLWPYFAFGLSVFLVSELLKFYITEVSGVVFNLEFDSAECFVPGSMAGARILSQGLLCATVSIVLITWMLGSSFARVN